MRDSITAAVVVRHHNTVARGFHAKSECKFLAAEIPNPVGGVGKVEIAMARAEHRETRSDTPERSPSLTTTTSKTAG